ncbi:hypothetical protein A0H81_10481 [Grifola frondosa]|uniref:F-box domain-containing protein n=1 Tax=Grifola frondosa TaxID=5627 RepID=A0A1C7LZ90_GRIFR|nr:hypothetical protein A0H81_10481 [Grifola frondosa]
MIPEDLPLLDYPRPPSHKESVGYLPHVLSYPPRPNPATIQVPPLLSLRLLTWPIFGMHHCLSITEILVEIVEDVYLDADPDAVPRGPSSVAALARTCRTFLEPSLDRLWRVQLSDVPLLKTLPDDFLRDCESVDNESDRLNMFIRMVRPELFSRFDTYAPRIKYFGTETHYFACTMLAHSLFLAFVEGYSRSFVSKTDPHAIHLSSNSHLVSILVGPSLQALRFGDFFIDELSSRHEMISPVALPSAILDIIQGSVNMRKFCFTVAPADEAIIHMASIPTLTEAQFRVNSIDAFRRLPRIPLRQWFPALQSLTICIPHIHFASALLQVIQPCQLRELRVICDHMPSALRLQQFLSILRGSCSHSSLVLFQLGVCHALETDLRRLVMGTPSVDIDIDIIAPLLEFTGLQSVWFDMSTAISMQMDNATLLHLATQLPRVEVLRFSAASPVTLAGLHSLIQHCRHLRTLELAIDITHDDLGPGDTSINERVTTIDLRSSILHGDSSMMARSLFRMFPNLQNIRQMDSNGSPIHRGFVLPYWQEVEQRIRNLRAAASSPAS